TFLGSGTTIVNEKKGIEQWAGAGWTGQPLIVDECGKKFLIQGCFDHHLKKIDAQTGDVKWEYAYDDILKGTGTIWKNDSAADPENRIEIIQGSRKGVNSPLCGAHAYSFRAVSYFTGKELWRMDVEHTASYSRDCDASALVISDTAYIGLENGKFKWFDPGKKTIPSDSFAAPDVFGCTDLYNREDAAHHGGNLVTESSPAHIGNHIYITAGSGHVYGFNLATKIIDWDFFIGSDMDGSPVVTSDSCLLIPVEKQYIAGNGGVFKLDPSKSPDNCVQWYFPSADFSFASWEGGVIGSVAVNDRYNDGEFPRLASFMGIDGYLTVVKYDHVRKDTLVKGPDGKTVYPCPEVVFRKRTGPSISTPLFVNDKLVAAGYSGICLFRYDRGGFFYELAFHPGIFEATPSADAGKIFIASRDGFLYCFGDAGTGTGKEALSHNTPAPVTQAVAAKKKKDAPPAVQKKEERNTFHLVAGAFRVKQNAVNFKKQWEAKGVSGSLIEAPMDLYYVSLFDTESKEAADRKHDELMKQFGADTWIYTGN
ncbi:MAG TPA: hypothetical protein VFU15_13120, partial [Bacteroidia bacterium]|nr:hypothetical protein [Bacteroidia bacterium]